MPRRNGFLSQIVYGKPDFAERPADLGDDFGTSVLLLSDPINDSHRVYSSMKDEIPVDTPPHRMKFAIPPNTNNVSSTHMKVMNGTRKGAVWGVGPTQAYFNVNSPNKKRASYLIFSNTRKAIFRTIKLADMAIRLPAMIFAFLQISFERVGFKAQTYYKSDNNPIGKAAAFLILGPIGLALNVVGAVPMRGMVFVSKVAAEAVRAPLAILGGAVGLVFGTLTAIGVGIGRLFGAAEQFNSAGNSIFFGMIDGIRPFAPEVANFLHVNYVKVIQDTLASMSVRRPFAAMPDTSIIRGKTIDVPWLSVAMLALAVTAVIALSVFTFGGAAAPFVPLLFTTAAHAAGFATTGLALAAFQVALIGGLTAVGTGIARGVAAFGSDTVAIAKDAYNTVTTTWKNFWQVRREARVLRSNNMEAGIEMRNLAALVAQPANQDLNDRAEINNNIQNPAADAADNGAGVGVGNNNNIQNLAADNGAGVAANHDPQPINVVEPHVPAQPLVDEVRRPMVGERRKVDTAADLQAMTQQVSALNNPPRVNDNNNNNNAQAIVEPLQPVRPRMPTLAETKNAAAALERISKPASAFQPHRAHPLTHSATTENIHNNNNNNRGNGLVVRSWTTIDFRKLDLNRERSLTKEFEIKRQLENKVAQNADEKKVHSPDSTPPDSPERTPPGSPKPGKK